MSTPQPNLPGLFLVTYEVSTGLPGAPVLRLHLTVSTPNRSITGLGEVTQAVNPPLDVTSSVSGDFTYLMLPDERVLIVLTGVPIPPTPIPPLPNLFARLVVDQTWTEGVGSYRFEYDGRWIDVDNALVKSVIVPTL